MSFQRILVEIAKNEIGVKEVTRNFSPRIVEYQQATTLPVGPWPWCAAFTAWCLRKALQESNFRGNIEQWRCKSAKAFDWEVWAKNRDGVEYIPNCVVPAKRGDFVVFDFSHIGIVAMDQLDDEKQIITIEGNTNRAGDREGDGVFAKRRAAHPSIISSYLRIKP